MEDAITYGNKHSNPLQVRTEYTPWLPTTFETLLTDKRVFVQIEDRK